MKSIGMPVSFFGLFQTSLISLLALQSGCKQRAFNAAKTRSSGDGAASCDTPVRIADYAQNKKNCYVVQGKEFDTVYNVDNKLKLYPWVPCNNVEFFSAASQAQFDYKTAIKTIRDKNPAPFNPELLAGVFAQPSNAYADMNGHPALQSPLHEGMVKVIRGAKHTIMLDIMLFGGAWGTELIREILVNKEKNKALEVVVMRDNDNRFAFDPELNPLWDALLDYGHITDGFTVLNAEIDERPSAIPLGLERLSFAYSNFMKVGLNPRGRSDHSKIIIADGFTTAPAMWVASKNTTDNNLLNYDEGLVVQGPAAAVAQLTYLPDLKLAAAKAQKNKKLSEKYSAEDKTLVNKWIATSESALKPDSIFAVPKAGNGEIRIGENNADDSVRNVEHTIYQLIRGAKKSVSLYNMLAYNPLMAKAIADAVVRLGPDNVHLLIDQVLTFTPNFVFFTMLKREGISDEDLNKMVRWRLTLKAEPFAKDSKRIAIDQQQHTKTILIDDDTVFLGSANFDMLAFEGAFREFSIAARMPQGNDQVKKAKATFDGIWNNPEEVVTNAQILEMRKKDMPSNTLVRGVMDFITTEQNRVRGLNPKNLPVESDCR